MTWESKDPPANLASGKAAGRRGASAETWRRKRNSKVKVGDVTCSEATRVWSLHQKKAHTEGGRRRLKQGKERHPIREGLAASGQVSCKECPEGTGGVDGL